MSNDTAAREGIAHYICSTSGAPITDERLEQLIDDTMFHIDDLIAKPIARPERHTYSPSDRAFYLVPCRRCSVVLNSGHHYPEVDGGPSPFAIEIADEHNAKKHGVTS